MPELVLRVGVRVQSYSRSPPIVTLAREWDFLSLFDATVTCSRASVRTVSRASILNGFNGLPFVAPNVNEDQAICSMQEDRLRPRSIVPTAGLIVRVFISLVWQAVPANFAVQARVAIRRIANQVVMQNSYNSSSADDVCCIFHVQRLPVRCSSKSVLRFGQAGGVVMITTGLKRAVRGFNERPLAFFRVDFNVVRSIVFPPYALGGARS